MKPLLVIADVHVGNHGRYGGPVVAGLNERCRRVLATLAHVARLAAASKADIAIAGDLFDTDQPSPAMVAAVFDALNVAGVQKFAAVGNHDITTSAEGDHALASLARMPGWTVVETPTVIEGLALLCPYDQRHPRDWLASTLAAHRATWALVHFGIEDDTTEPWLRGKAGYHANAIRDAVADAGYLGLLAGDWHAHKSFADGVAYQIGALCPTGYANPGWDGGGWAALLETTGVRWFRIAGPRFLQVATEDDAAAAVAHATANGCALYLEWSVREADRGAAEALRTRWAAAGVTTTLVVTSSGARVSAAEAAQRVRDVGQTDRAVGEYLAGYALPDLVDRDEVAARVHAHVRRVRG